MGKIIVTGSSVNPPHLGHVDFVRAFLKIPDVVKVYWIPCGERVEKKYSVAPHHRRIMNEIAFKSLSKDPRFENVNDDVEGVNTSTIEWMRHYEAKHPEHEVHFGAGSDIITPNEEFGRFSDGTTKCDIHTWEESEELINHFGIFAIRRRGFLPPRNLPKTITLIDANIMDVSSRQIREMFKQGNASVVRFLNPEVFHYINKHNLYIN